MKVCKLKAWPVDLHTKLPPDYSCWMLNIPFLCIVVRWIVGEAPGETPGETLN